MSSISLQNAGGLPDSGLVQGSQLKIDIKPEAHPASDGDVAQFRAALDRHAQNQFTLPQDPADARKVSLGDRMAARATDLASEVKKDQQYVSKLLEHASSTGDSMHLMKAMMALNDYQIRVQAISKTVAKSTSALEQLTKLQ